MIIVDIDGTIADCRHREHLLEPQLDVESCKQLACPYLLRRNEPECLRPAACEHKNVTQIQWDAFLDEQQLMKDSVIPLSHEVLTQANLYHEIIYLTGRSERTKKATVLWLKDVFGYKGSINIVMRPANNRDTAEVLKDKLLSEIKLAHPSGGGLFAFDDDEVAGLVYKKHDFQWFHAPHCWSVIHKTIGLFK